LWAALAGARSPWPSRGAVAIRPGAGAALPYAFRPSPRRVAEHQSLPVDALVRLEDGRAAITEAGRDPPGVWRRPARTRFAPTVSGSRTTSPHRIGGGGRREEALAAITEGASISAGVAAPPAGTRSCPDLAGR